jgi:hypothetical protein
MDGFYWAKYRRGREGRSPHPPVLIYSLFNSPNQEREGSPIKDDL